MRERPTISVIIPVYNVEKYLDVCVSDVIAQSFSDIEIILVDDGSVDSSGAQCDRWQEKDSRIKVLHQKNSGVCEARNTGLENAAGKWIIFIDADDRINRELFSTLVKAQSEGKADLTGTGYQLFSDTVETNDCGGVQRCAVGKRKYITLRGGEYICGALYNRELIEQARLRFDTSLVRHEEVFWNTIYAIYCKKRIFTSPARYYYRINPSSLMHSRDSSDKAVRDWLLARQALNNWGSKQTLSLKKARCLRTGEFHCEKNCFAESVAAGFNYSVFRSICDSCGIPKAGWNSQLRYKCFELLLRSRKRR